MECVGTLATVVRVAEFAAMDLRSIDIENCAICPKQTENQDFAIILIARFLSLFRYVHYTLDQKSIEQNPSRAFGN